MADPPPYPGIPRWVKIFALTALVLGLVAAIALLAGAGHGPGRHFVMHNDAGKTSVADDIE